MNIFENVKSPLTAGLSTQLVYLLVLSVLLWATGAPAFLKYARAAQITQVSDTLSTSDASTTARHIIRFNASTYIAGSETIIVTPDTTSGFFVEAGSAATSTNILLYQNNTQISNVADVGACAANSFFATANYNTGVGENLTLTLCSTTTIATSSPIKIVIGSTTPVWTNPGTTGSYHISLTGTMGTFGNANESGDAQVAILSHVTLTASVSTTFTFTVNGMDANTAGRNDFATTTITSTATTLPFGLLSALVPVTLAQRLNVTTNAANGFSVTVQESQPPTSSTGATIDLFKDGATTTSPTHWTSPSNTPNNPATYGHLGITSDDGDLSVISGNAADNFAFGNYVGNIDQPRLVFNHNGPTDGLQTNQGSTTVAYKIEIASLQEAGNDYTSNLWYVATPTF